MTYDPTAPPGDQKIKNSFNTLQNNFAALNSVFGQDHVNFTDATGKHRKIEFNENNTPGSQVSDQSSIYTAGTPPQLKFKNSAVDYFLTGVFSNATPGYAFLLGGFLVQWGTETAIGTKAVTFPTAFGANPYYIGVTIKGTVTTKIASYANETTTGFKIHTNGTGLTVKWLAIGSAP